MPKKSLTPIILVLLIAAVLAGTYLIVAKNTSTSTRDAASTYLH
jgi:multidrug resistance efflux pump